MADNSDAKKSAEPQEQIRATARSAAQGVTETAQRGAGALEQASRSGGDATRQGGEAMADITRRSSEAGARAMRHLGDAAGETARRSVQAAAESQQQLAQSAADQLEETARKVAQAVQGTADDLRALMVLPTIAGGGLPELQQGVGSLVEGVIRTNLRATQEIFRLANPGALVELQQRFLREYLDTLIQGSAAIVRAARQAADQTLWPLERQLEQRHQARQAWKHGRDGESQEPSARVADVMAREVRVANPEDTVQHAARLMREEDTGALPVGEGDRLVGMVTDRDVALRLVAEGKDPARTKVREVMTPEVRYVFEDEELDHVADDMAQQQVRRLPVVNRDKRLVGVVSLGDFARNGRAARLATRALQGVARPGGQHTQSAAD